MVACYQLLSHPPQLRFAWIAGHGCMLPVVEPPATTVFRMGCTNGFALHMSQCLQPAKRGLEICAECRQRRAGGNGSRKAQTTPGGLLQQLRELARCAETCRTRRRNWQRSTCRRHRLRLPVPRRRLLHHHELSLPPLVMTVACRCGGSHRPRRRNWRRFGSHAPRRRPSRCSATR